MNKNYLIGFILIVVMSFSVLAEADLYDNLDMNGYNITNGKMSFNQTTNHFPACPSGSAEIMYNETGRYCDANIINTTELASAISGISGASINGSALNLTQLYAGDISLPRQDTGACPNRPLVSNANRTLSVPSVYPNISAALCEVPYFLNHVYTISTNPTTYNAAFNCSEDISISNVHGTRDMDYKGGQLRFTGGSASSYVCVDSIMVSGVTGQANPKIQYYRVNGWNDDYSLSSKCQICMFGVQQFDLYRINLTSSWNNRNETHGILAYGGTKGKLSGIHIDNSSWFGVSVKQGSEVWIRDEGISGYTKAIAYGVSIGNIFTRDEISGTSALYGGSTLGNYATDQGFLMYTDNSDGVNQSVVGIDRLPDLDELVFIESAINWRDTLSRGWRMMMNTTNDEFTLEVKNATTATLLWNISRTTGSTTIRGDCITMVGDNGAANFSVGC